MAFTRGCSASRLTGPVDNDGSGPPNDSGPQLGRQTRPVAPLRRADHRGPNHHRRAHLRDQVIVSTLAGVRVMQALFNELGIATAASTNRSCIGLAVSTVG